MPRWLSWWPRWKNRTSSPAHEHATAGREQPLLIAQITDLHIGRSPITVGNATRLEAVVRAVARARPDVVLLTGDLTDGGRPEDYARVRDAMEPLSPAPILPLMGNHDARPGFRQVLQPPGGSGDFVQYEWSGLRGRVLVLDTMEPGRHAGAFCEARAAWLRERLDAAPDTPTLIALHHPPARSGIGWMDTDSDGDWTRRLADALRNRPQVAGLVAGHLHRAAVLPFGEHRITVAPSVAPQVGLDLSPLDPERADGRSLIVDAPPGFALHLWTAAGLVTHFASAGEEPVLARFDASTDDMVAGLSDEAR